MPAQGNMGGNNYNNNYGGQSNSQRGYNNTYGQPAANRAQIVPVYKHDDDPYGLTNNIMISTVRTSAVGF
jgi:hypothetical protein